MTLTDIGELAQTVDENSLAISGGFGKIVLGQDDDAADHIISMKWIYLLKSQDHSCFSYYW